MASVASERLDRSKLVSSTYSSVILSNLTFSRPFASLVISVFTDVHGVVQQSPEKSRHRYREHRGRLQEWVEVDAAPGGDLRRDPAQTRPRQDAVPQDRQR